MQLDRIWLSEALAEEAGTLGLEVLGGPEPLTFNSLGNLF